MWYAVLGNSFSDEKLHKKVSPPSKGGEMYEKYIQ